MSLNCTLKNDEDGKVYALLYFTTIKREKLKIKVVPNGCDFNKKMI